MGNRVRSRGSQQIDAQSSEEEHEDATRQQYFDTESDEDVCPFIYGDVVHDTDDEKPEDLVVVNVPNLTIKDWVVADGETAADRNPRCPPTDWVVITVHRDTLDDYLPKWDERDEDIPVSQLVKDDVPHTARPSVRLDIVEPSHLRGEE